MSEGTVKPIDCFEGARRLWAYLDRELEPSLAAEVERHLAECTSCSSLCQTQRRFLDVVRDLPADVAGSADLLARVQALLRTSNAPRQPHDR